MIPVRIDRNFYFAGVIERSQVQSCGFGEKTEGSFFNFGWKGLNQLGHNAKYLTSPLRKITRAGQNNLINSKEISRTLPKVKGEYESLIFLYSPFQIGMETYFLSDSLNQNSQDLI